MSTEGLTFRDKLIRCAECGTEFVFTVTEQREMARKGLPVEEPKLCPACRKLAAMKGRQRGKVKWFSLQKGYGFVIAEDGKEFFFHRTDIVEGGIPAEGQEVEFEIERTAKGNQAVRVKIL